MTTTREAALIALTSLVTAALAPVLVTRDPDKALDMSADGIVVVRDGQPGDPEILIGGPLYAWAHQAELEFMVIGEGRSPVMDALLAKIDPALKADRTLGGKVNYASLMTPPDITEVPIEQAETVRAALLHVQLEYTTASAAG